MAFTYDLATDIGKVRLNIGDTEDAIIESGSGVRWNGENLQDEEIQVYLDGGSIAFATQRCFLMLAGEYSSKATTLQMGSFREEMEMVATELRRQASYWTSIIRDEARDPGDGENANSIRSTSRIVSVVF